MQAQGYTESAPSAAADARRLASARVLVVGVGALGSAAAWCLAAAGVRTLILVDPDQVELSNLPRQLLYGPSALGAGKAERAAARLRERFAPLRVEARAIALTADNAAALLGEADFSIDATDGAATKFVINDAAVGSGASFCHAGVLGFRGQLLSVRRGTGPCLRCLFPDAPDDAEVATCQQAGIVNAVAGIVGAQQAAEAISFLLGRGGASGLLTFDGHTGRWRCVPLRRNRHCPLLCGGAAADGGMALCGS